MGQKLWSNPLLSLLPSPKKVGLESLEDKNVNNVFVLPVIRRYIATSNSNISIRIEFKLIFRPVFVKTLFPVTRPHCIYSTALVIIIIIRNT